MQNLWTEFDKEPSEKSAGSAQIHSASRRSAQRLPTEKAILSSLRTWLLKDYLAPYCRSLASTRIYQRCYWIDGLGFHSRSRPQIEQSIPNEPDTFFSLEQSGPQDTEKTSTTAPASSRSKSSFLQPIESLAQILAHESKPITLLSMFLEPGNSKRKETQNRESPGKQPALSLPKEHGITRASWMEIGPTILETIDQSPAIFLLNPFGPQLLTYEDLVPLFQRTAPTELCLFVSYNQIEMGLLPSLQTLAGAAALTALVHSDRWKAPLTQGADSIHVIDSIINIFISSMQRHFLTVQRIPLLIQVRPAVIENAPYVLIFATRRQDSLISMNDALCLYRRQLSESSSRGVLMEEWFIKQQQERHIEELKRLHSSILKQGRSQRARRWPELRQQLLIANFGQFTLQDYNQALNTLLRKRDVRCEWNRKPPDDSGDWVPGNTDTLIW